MPPKQRLSVSSVIGKVVVYAEDGEKISQWGGTECCLSCETGVGPCLVVRSSRHKRGQGVLFKLTGLRRVHAMFAGQGKLSVVVAHMRRVCTVCITTTESVKQVEYMSAVLQQKAIWGQIERDVLRPHLGAGSKRGLDNEGGGSFAGVADVVFEGGADGDRDPGGGGGGPQNSASRAVHRRAGSEDPENQYREMLSTPAGQSRQPAATVGKHGAVLGTSVSLTDEQQTALNRILGGSNVFVTGCAGTGKSEWLQHVISRLPRDESTVVTASTGIAARRVKGTTVHSFAGIGIGEGSFEELLARVKSRPEVMRSWTKCRRWIIDEIGMIPAPLFSLLDKLGRAIKKHTTDPFGGIQMILVGDFLQLPPVQQGPDGEPLWCFLSPAWGQLGLRCTQFSRSFRHQADQAFDSCLRDVRMGVYSSTVEDVLKGCLGRSLACGFGVVPTRIMALNADVDKFNEAQLAQIDAPYERYYAEDATSVNGIDLNNEVSLPSLLTLKEGAQVITLMQIPDTPFRNGDTGVVVGFVATSSGKVRLPMVRFSSGEEQLIDFAAMEVRGRGGFVLATRRQIPLRLGWALTVHRTQGMTIPFAEIALNRAFFEFGQAYTALSRVRRAEDLRLTEFDPTVIKAHPRCIEAMMSMFPVVRIERQRQEQQRAQQAAAKEHHRMVFEVSPRKGAALQTGGDNINAAPSIPTAADGLAGSALTAPAAKAARVDSSTAPRSVLLDD